MKCCECGKNIDGGEAVHCAECLRDYCPECAAKKIICDCCGEIVRYH